MSEDGTEYKLRPNTAVVEAGVFTGRKRSLGDNGSGADNDAGENIHAVLQHVFPDRFPSQSSAKRACRRREVLVNGSLAQTKDVVHPGSTVQIVQRIASGGQLSLDTAPVAIQATQEEGALFRPREVHRLDDGTGGLLLAAKTRAAQQALSQAFRDRTVTKRYRALVQGKLDGEGCINQPVKGRPSTTKYRAVSASRSAGFGWITTVDLWPCTGRQHQLRRHMRHLGHPILGDRLYLNPCAYSQKDLSTHGSGTAEAGCGEDEVISNAANGCSADCLCPEPFTGAGGAGDLGDEAGDSPGVQPTSQHSVPRTAPVVELPEKPEQLPPPPPSPDADGQLRDAAAATSRPSSFDCLGSELLCLWALELQLDHPVLPDQPLHLQLPEPASFRAVRDRHHQLWARAQR